MTTTLSVGHGEIDMPMPDRTTQKEGNTAMESPSRFTLAILGALQRRNVYQGTVPDAVTAKRRAANSQARKSRRINRRRSS